MAGDPLVVQALFTFKGSNNDELCFKKGDVITVTQKDEGWWEGTLNGKTGWFPSNYVKECIDVPVPIVQQENQYKNVVLKDLIDSEKAYVQELEGLISNYLQPLEKNNVIGQDEFKQLTSNIADVLETHQQLLKLVEQEFAKPGSDQLVGKLFLTWAPKVKAVHQIFCSLHPRAAVILDKCKDELSKFMESRGAVSPGILVLTTLLSKPFRRLEKYSGILQELERHVEECHPDRGDTQRSVSIYKEIATTCLATRRQKELELQVLTGPVRGWEGPSLATLGDIIYMGSVAVGTHHHDRYFVLFPTTLVILSVSHRLSAFIYEGKLFLSGLTVCRLEDTESVKNAFEISAPMIDRRVVICQSRQEADHWVELLSKHVGSRVSTTSTNSGHKVLPSQAQYVPQPPPHQQQQHHHSTLNHRGYTTRTSVLAYKTSINYRPTYPPSHYPSAAPYAALTKYFSRKIREKVITRKLLRNLLYIEHLNKMNLNAVKIRHHKTEIVIVTKNLHIRDSVINCSDSDDEDDESESSNEDFNLKRQNALMQSDTSSSDSSNPFGYIRYYNPQTGSEKEETYKFESFIDYGAPYAPQPVPKIVEEQPKKPSVMLTSTANLNLLKKQWSEESNASSLAPARNPGMACENLLMLNESLEMDNLRAPELAPQLPMMRRSCPTKLVGNKFNQSSLTAVYIPPWSGSENNIACVRKQPQETRRNSSQSSSTTTHSSSLEVPVNPVPLPDAMVGELLYGEFAKSVSVETVIKPPTMFTNTTKTDNSSSSTVSLNMEHVPFRKHSINSDKPRRRCSIQLNPTDLLNSAKALKRCVSSKYLNMKAGTSQCRCGLENCHSPRSSDSGMAGSCTLNSPDMARAMMMRDSGNSEYNMALFNDCGISLSEIDAQTYENECPCSSPFGSMSTPRTSSEASHTRDSLCTTSVTSMEMAVAGGPQKSKSTGSILDCVNLRVSEHGGNEAEGADDEDEDAPTFKSGLYAHWWLKAKLPPEVIRGIYEGTRAERADVSVGRRPKP
ncbi:uncharacterized protein LOC126738917 isoform X2 [Anthonomus grandis grandis]|uniref:uncharacterized protein LOC126738917 isoform X2 n=1 Tax=Anthonomus grandis grandis TaxID=2921223 RepID=UPI002165CD46|nr:uncharacterized protein LOC126738917 isoform X2 [Anthonomus grandis grandis]